MKSNQEILDEFGKIITNDCFDPAYANLLGLKQKENPPLIFKEFSELFKKMNKKDFQILQKYFSESLKGILFNFLRGFEENEEFKLYYEKDEQKVNLVEISEMLKAEPIIENGWIERFSKELKSEK
ncbi:hypothetical protein [Tenacibaculum soleae]|uniref:hypothetical protein n=1 Tax=Tenacibaculum soleae TaxID=447689 RepID=UPI0023009351|nr:hypothetical protein [Tenacibaculum soleae]